MNTSKVIEQLSLEQVLEAINNYERTIQALHCFASCVTWDEHNASSLSGSIYSLGREMDNNAGETLTPDAVIQRDNQLGYLVEAKISLPMDKNHWEKEVEQLLKYDDISLGWWTKDESIAHCCVVMLIHIARSAEFEKLLLTNIQTQNIQLSNPLSVVEFTRDEQVNPFIFIRKRPEGQIFDSSMSERLTTGVEVPLLKVLGNPKYGNEKFYDSPPIDEYIMGILWQEIFTYMKSEVERDEELKAYPLIVSVTELTDELQMLHGSKGSQDDPRNVTFPRESWVRSALEAFERIGLAEHQGNGDYLVKFKRIKTKNIYKKFSEHRTNRGKQELSGEQLTLFENENTENI